VNLPHPDRTHTSPWSDWPEHLPQPAAAARSIEHADEETRHVHRITMPNGATAERWTVINSWDGDEEHSFAGDWTPYGLDYSEEYGLLTGIGSDKVYEVIEEWVRQDRGIACATCHCSGRIAAYPFVSVHDSWITCPTCLGMARIPHPPA
jgi:hypothetical protein